MKRLADALTEVKERVRFCSICGNISEQDTVPICRDPRRTRRICVVEESKDVMAIERTRSFRGRYHVLGGAINPIAGIGPDQLHIRELLNRLADGRYRGDPRHRPESRGRGDGDLPGRLLKTIGIR